jgi:hypothetical protein
MYSWTHSLPRHYMDISGQIRAQAALPRGKNPGALWIGGWIGPRASLDVSEKRKNIVQFRDFKFVISTELEAIFQLALKSDCPEMGNYKSPFVFHALAKTRLATVALGILVLCSCGPRCWATLRVKNETDAIFALSIRKTGLVYFRLEWTCLTETFCAFSVYLLATQIYSENLFIPLYTLKRKRAVAVLSM